MSSKQKVTWASTATIVILAITVLFVQRGDSRLVRRVLHTQEQLVAKDSPLSGRARVRAIEQMIRDVDKLGREDLRSLSRAVQDRYRSLMQQTIDKYHESDEDQQLAILDDQIAQEAQWREVYSALGRRAMRGGRRRRGPGQVDRDRNGATQQNPRERRPQAETENPRQRNREDRQNRGFGLNRLIRELENEDNLENLSTTERAEQETQVKRYREFLTALEQQREAQSSRP